MRNRRTGLALLVLVCTAPALAADEASGPARDPLDRVASCALRGGCVSLRGLEPLAGHAEPEVRAAVFDAVARIGLRHGRLAERARKATEDPCPAVRRAALAALGALGTGEDVPHLLTRLEDPDGRLRSAARAALERLSGARLPPSPPRWHAWWNRAKEDGPRLVRTALDEIEAKPACDTAERARREQVVRHGWIEPDLVTERVGAWLASTDRRLRAEALRLVCGLRLADLEDEVRSALPFLDEEDAPLGEHVATVLGS